eukprot:TRINITY_DN278_c0_g1_i4.p1 TRINITY_DN278_c0_g1~~TRINITY_DN278_c0_g1_i4.p1  ORF type:complete len:557 (+),score=126.55 TRINITY_DN278_c0_g1_i4:95-1765(+)
MLTDVEDLAKVKPSGVFANVVELPEAEKALPPYAQRGRLNKLATAKELEGYVDPVSKEVIPSKYFLEKRECCGDKCRHCPHNFKNVPSREDPETDSDDDDDDDVTTKKESPFVLFLDNPCCIFGNDKRQASEIPSSSTCVRHSASIEFSRRGLNIFQKGFAVGCCFIDLLFGIKEIICPRSGTPFLVTEAPDDARGLIHKGLSAELQLAFPQNPKYYTCPEALTLLTHGQTSGIVVTIQSSYAKVVPILNGEPLVNCITIHDGFELPVWETHVAHVLPGAKAHSLRTAIAAKDLSVLLLDTYGRCKSEEFYSLLQHPDFPPECSERSWLECEKVFCQSMGRIVHRSFVPSYEKSTTIVMTGLTEKIHECVRLLPKAVLMKVCKRVVLDGPGADIRGMCERVEEELFPDPPEEGGVWTIGGDPLEKGVSDGLVRQQQAGSRFYEVRDTVYNLEMFTAMQGGTVQSIAPLQPPIPPTFSSLPPDVVRTVLSFLGPLLIYTDGHRVTRGPLGQSARQAYLGGLVAVERTSREAIAEVSKLDSRRGVRVLLNTHSPLPSF